LNPKYSVQTNTALFAAWTRFALHAGRIDEEYHYRWGKNGHLGRVLWTKCNQFSEETDLPTPRLGKNLNCFLL